MQMLCSHMLGNDGQHMPCRWKEDFHKWLNCIRRRTVIDYIYICSNMLTSLVCCRLAKQVAIYYGEIRSMLSQPPLNQHFDKSWLCHTGVKATLYEAEVQNQAAMALHAEQEIGSETARIKVPLPACMKVLICIIAEANSSKSPAIKIGAIHQVVNTSDREFFQRREVISSHSPSFHTCLLSRPVHLSNLTTW